MLRASLVVIARSPSIGKLGGSRFPYFLDDFNEPCTAVVKKRTGTPVFVRYSSKCSYLAQMIQHFLKFIFVRVFKRKGFWGLLSTWRPLFVKKGFLCAILLIFECQ